MHPPQLSFDGAAEAEALAVLGASPAAFERQTHSMDTPGVWLVEAGGGRAALKLLRRIDVAGSDDPSHFRYWLREALVYAGGVPEPYLDSGVRAPRLLARFDRPDGDVALWLEHVGGPPAVAWELAAYGEFAERLGRAQGAYMAGVSLPDAAWACRDYIRQYFAERATHTDYGLLQSEEAWSLPPIARNYPPDLRRELLRLHDDRDRFLGWLDRMPRTFAHHDVWTGNMLAAGGETVLLDWAFCGPGGIGQDVGNMVPDAVFDMQCPPSILRPLDREASSGYLRGLRAAGATVDERIVRLGICASAAKYDWIIAANLQRAINGGATQRIYGGRDVEADVFFANRAAVLRFIVEWAAEARSLARSLGFD